MLRYEALLLTVPEITGDEAKNLEGQIDKVMAGQKGSMVSFERWGKYKLSFPVKKNDYGVYFLARFEVPQGTTVIEDIRNFFEVKLNNIVMRSMFTALDQKASLAYQRPKSLEEAPSRDVESFLKENKMAGLLSSVEGPEAAPKKEKTAAAEQVERQEVAAEEQEPEEAEEA